MSTFLLQLERAQGLITHARKSFLKPNYLVAIPQHSLPGQPSIYPHRVGDSNLLGLIKLTLLSDVIKKIKKKIKRDYGT